MELSPGSRHGSGDAPEVRAPRPAAATVAPRWKRPRRRRLRAGRGRDPAAHQRPAARALCQPRRRGAAGRVARGRRGPCCALSRLPGCDRRRREGTPGPWGPHPQAAEAPRLGVGRASRGPRNPPDPGGDGGNTSSGRWEEGLGPPATGGSTEGGLEVQTAAGSKTHVTDVQ